MTNKIVFVNRFFHPDISATSQMLSDLAFQLSQRHNVHVVTSRLTYEGDADPLPARERFRQVTVHRVWTTRFGRGSLLGRACDYVSFNVSISFRLMRLLQRGDVVVAMTDPPLLSVPIAAIARLKGAIAVNWLHDIFPEIAMMLDFRRARALRGPLTWLRNRSLAAARYNIVLGSRMAETIAPHTGSETIRVIPNWASGDHITPMPRDSNPLRRKWGLDGKFVVGYSGNFGRAHDFKVLLGAARRLSGRPDIAFLLIGGGKQRAELERHASEQGLSNVVFRSYQPREVLSQSLSAADCHIVSLKPELEGLLVPSKIYSAMAAARPVVFLGAEDGEIPRMMKNRPTFGFCLDPDDEAGLVRVIEGMSAHPESAAALGEAGRRLFEQQFDQPIGVGKWATLITALGVGSRLADVTPSPSPRAALVEDDRGSV